LSQVGAPLAGMNRAHEVAARLAAGQNGVLTTTQLRELGVPPRSAGHLGGAVLVAVHRGVRRHAAVPPSWLTDLAAAVVGGGPAAVASHRSAARLLGFDCVFAGTPEVTVPSLDVPVHRGVRYHRTNLLAPVDV